MQGARSPFLSAVAVAAVFITIFLWTPQGMIMDFSKIFGLKNSDERLLQGNPEQIKEAPGGVKVNAAPIETEGQLTETGLPGETVDIPVRLSLAELPVTEPPAQAISGWDDLQVAPREADEILLDPIFAQFVERVRDGKKDVVRGLYAAGVLALPVLQQPDDNGNFVSSEDGTATQFRAAAQQGVTGLLAHNYLSGQEFYNLVQGEQIQIVYGDGSFRTYSITEIEQYQRLGLPRLDGDFIDLYSGERLPSSEIFARYYSGGDRVTLQTCLERDGNLSWGLHFVTAVPVGN